MKNNVSKTYNPDWVSPPGGTILDILEERGWTQAVLAQRTGYTTNDIDQLIKGNVPITEQMAIDLERIIGGSAHFWLAREAQYRQHLIRISDSVS
jgi:HTH-type transcriptional regulator/antitoxin HigA